MTAAAHVARNAYIQVATAPRFSSPRIANFLGCSTEWVRVRAGRGDFGEACEITPLGKVRHEYVFDADRFDDFLARSRVRTGLIVEHCDYWNPEHMTKQISVRG